MLGCQVFGDRVLDHLPVFFNLINDGQADLQGAAGVLAGDAGRRPVPHAVHERFELQPERFLIFHFGLLK